MITAHIQLRHTISPDRSTLTLWADAEAQAAVRELIEEEGTGRDAESEALEYLIGNSELCWVSAEDTGDLTDAPILGILGDECHKNSGPHGAVYAGRDAGGTLYHPVLERWGFEPYQIRSFLTDLAENGRAVFQNHW